MFALAWPAFLQGLLHTAVFIADRVLLGRYGTAELSSLQVSGPLTWSVVSVFTSFVAGSTALVARAWGAGDRERARRAGVVTLQLACGLGLAAAAVAGLGTRWIVRPFGLDPASEACAVTYLRATGAAFPFFFVAFAGTAILRAAGDTRTPLVLALLANAVKLAASGLLIFGLAGAPRLGILGAGLGTALAMGVECGLVLWVLLGGRAALSLRRDRSPSAGPAAPVLGPLLSVSLPALAERLVFHAGFLVSAGMVARLGATASAANQACVAVESLSFIPADAFGIAAATIMGQKLGARRPEEARSGGASAVWMAVGFLSLMGTLYFALSAPLAALFSADREVVRLAAFCLAIGALAQPPMAVGIALAQGLRGAGDTWGPLVVTLAGIWGVRIAACWLFAFHFRLGLAGIWIGTTIDWAVRAAILVALFRRGRWSRIEL